MSHRFFTGAMALISLALLAPARVTGQVPSTPKKNAPAKPWTLPRTPDGQPDFEGVWAHAIQDPTWTESLTEQRRGKG